MQAGEQMHDDDELDAQRDNMAAGFGFDSWAAYWAWAQREMNGAD